MATVEEQRQAASDLLRIADDVRAINPPVLAASGPDVLSGGNLGDSLANFIDEQRVVGLSIGAELDELASAASVAASIQEAEEAEAAAQALASVGVV